MAKFVPNQSTEVKSDEPLLEVAVEPANPLKVGKYLFRLVVTDDSGNESASQDVTIIVTDTDRPTAVIDVINVAGERIPSPTVTIPFGQRFTLTGDRSSDVGGTVRTYLWTLAQ